MRIKTNAKKLNQKQHKNFTWFPQCEVRQRDRNPIPLSTKEFLNDNKRDTNDLTNHLKVNSKKSQINKRKDLTK